jgi:hypothetical protein
MVVGVTDTRIVVFFFFLPQGSTTVVAAAATVTGATNGLTTTPLLLLLLSLAVVAGRRPAVQTVQRTVTFVVVVVVIVVVTVQRTLSAKVVLPSSAAPIAAGIIQTQTRRFGGLRQDRSVQSADHHVVVVLLADDTVRKGQEGQFTTIRIVVIVFLRFLPVRYCRCNGRSYDSSGNTSTRSRRITSFGIQMRRHFLNRNRGQHRDKRLHFQHGGIRRSFAAVPQRSVPPQRLLLLFQAVVLEPAIANCQPVDTGRRSRRSGGLGGRKLLDLRARQLRGHLLRRRHPLDATSPQDNGGATDGHQEHADGQPDKSA